MDSDNLIVAAEKKQDNLARRKHSVRKVGGEGGGGCFQEISRGGERVYLHFEKDVLQVIPLNYTSSLG